MGLRAKALRLAAALIAGASTLPALPSHADPIGGVEQINYDPGGRIADYVDRLQSFKARGVKVVFSGTCGSSCTLLLNLPADRLCVTPEATFLFHAPSAPTPSGVEAARAFLMSRYPRWVREWLAAQGGLSPTVKTMDAAYTRHFLKSCE